MSKELARQIKREERRETLRLIADIAKNPVFEILAGYIIIETLQRVPFTINGEQKVLIPQLAGTVAEAGILAAVAMQQLAPIAPYLAQGGLNPMDKVEKLLPALPLLMK